jgi:hypothetical protein
MLSTVSLTEGKVIHEILRSKSCDIGPLIKKFWGTRRTLIICLPEYVT